jgi:pimeloyl-ACP methyl ester carboxylesterase
MHMATTLTIHSLTRPAGTLAYDVAGDGPLVICLPGLGELRSAYRELRPRLVAAGWRVATVDLRGHGGSSVGWDAYGADAMGADLVALIEELGPRALLVGNSYGAGPAVWAGAERPDLVAGLVLTGPFVREQKLRPALRLAMKAMFMGPWRVAAWDGFYGSLFRAGVPADHAAHRARLRANLREPGRFGALQAMLNRSDAAIEARLARVSVPSLVVMGSADPDFRDPRAEADAVAEALRGRAEIMAGVGHYPHLEVPDQLAERIGAFAREVGHG